MSLDGLQITHDRISVQVANQIKALIASRQLKPGERLPAERELAEQLGISRSVLREAIKFLEQQGLLSVQVGRGTFVVQVEPEDVSNAFAESMHIMMQQIIEPGHFEYFYEIRRMIELEVAWIAAQRATEEDLDRIGAYLDMMQTYHQTNIEKFTQADTDFHQALAQATQNPLFLTLLMSITKLLRQIQFKASSTLGGPAKAITFHTRILDAIRAQDSAASRQAMAEHLDDVFSRLQTVNGQDEGATSS